MKQQNDVKNKRQIYFAKASFKDKDTIFSWLADQHMQEFWDNSQEHLYEKFGFVLVGDYVVDAEITRVEETFFGVFNGETSYLMEKHYPS